MAFTYSLTDLSSNRSRVRLLLRDTNSAAAIFQDEEIDAFLAVEGDGVKRSAALGLETMASNEAYVQKVIRLLELSTNGAQTAASLMKRAEMLRDQAAEEEAGAAGGGLDWAEWGVLTPQTERERLWNEALRN